MKKIHIIIAIIVLTLGVLAFVLWQKDNILSDIVSQTATTTEPVATSTDIFDMEPIIPEAKVSTEGWKTCRNEEYGWEVKYPEEWYVYGDGHHSGVEGSTWGGYYTNETECVGGRVVLAEWEPGTSFSTLTTGEMRKSLSINTDQENFGTYPAHITDVHELAKSYPKLDLHGIYAVDGEEVVIFETSIDNRDGAIGWTANMYHDTRLYELSSGAVDINVLETMLTTFQFLDTSTSTQQ